MIKIHNFARSYWIDKTGIQDLYDVVFSKKIMWFLFKGTFVTEEILWVYLQQFSIDAKGSCFFGFNPNDLKHTSFLSSDSIWKKYLILKDRRITTVCSNLELVFDLLFAKEKVTGKCFGNTREIYPHNLERKKSRIKQFLKQNDQCEIANQDRGHWKFSFFLFKWYRRRRKQEK